MEKKFKYDLFISYATDPDLDLAVDLESFLESFHKVNTPGNIELKKLNVCVDSSDFLTEKGSNKDVDDIISDKLRQSEELLFICSINSSVSEWCLKELQWFISNRGEEYVKLGISEPVSDAVYEKKILPEVIISKDIHKKIWYDFRGKAKNKNRISQIKVKDYEASKLRLACDLLNLPIGDVQPLWFRKKIQNERIKRYYITAVFSVIIITLLSVFAYVDNNNYRSHVKSLILTGSSKDAISGLNIVSSGKTPAEYQRFWRVPYKLKPKEIWELLKKREDNHVKAEVFLKGIDKIITGKLQFDTTAYSQTINTIIGLIPVIDDPNSLGMIAAFLDYIHHNKASPIYFKLRRTLREELIEVIGHEAPNIPFVDDWHKAGWTRIAKGEFEMGCIESLEGPAEEDNELPPHSVSIDSFTILSHEVTNEMIKNFRKIPVNEKGDEPVSNISWYDAYTASLWFGARLPTEAEWEYSCRGNQTERASFTFGNSEVCLDASGWYRKNSDGRKQRIMTKAPNGFGLFDMHGNVYEWCLDYFEYYSKESKSNPIGPSKGITRVQRGGAYKSDPKFCTTSNRGKLEPHRELPDVGFRMVLVEKNNELSQKLNH